MSVFKKIILCILGLVDILCVLMMAGYIKWGIEMPNHLAGREMQFMGAYLLAMAFFAVVIILTVIFILCFFKWRKNGKER